MNALKVRVRHAAFLVLLVPLVVTDVATAEVPVLGSFLDTGQLGQTLRHGHARRHHKPFLHHEGLESLRGAKREAAVLAPGVAAGPRWSVASMVSTRAHRWRYLPMAPSR